MSDPAPRPAEYAALTSDDLVTGEAVALDLPPASLGSRMASGLIDLAMTAVLLLGVWFLFGLAASRSGPALAWVAVVGTLIMVFVALPTAVETLTRGKSLGKAVLGLRTVRDDAGPISFHHAFVRALVGVVEIYAFTGGPAFFSALLNGRSKRLGDHAAGTYVVRERFRLRLPEPPAMPPHLAGWAAGADVARLPTPLALAVRQFLGRAGQISVAARHDLGGRLAGQVAGYVAPAPPPGTPAEDFLAAVVATRRERDAARLRRQAALRRRLTETR